MESVLIVCFLLSLLAAVIAHSVSFFVMIGCVRATVKLSDSWNVADEAFRRVRRMSFFGLFASVVWLLLDASPFILDVLPLFVPYPIFFVFIDAIFFVPYLIGTVSFCMFVRLMRNCLGELSDAGAGSDCGHTNIVFPKGANIAMVVCFVCALAMLVAVGVLWHKGSVLQIVDLSSGSDLDIMPMDPPSPMGGWR